MPDFTFEGTDKPILQASPLAGGGGGGETDTHVAEPGQGVQAEREVGLADAEPIVGRFDRPSGPSAGMLEELTATVEIEVQREQGALSVPVQAVVHRRAKDLPQTELFSDWLDAHPPTPAEKGKDRSMRFLKVAFVKQDGVARAKPVETGISDQQRIAILAGLTEEDDVIIGPFRTLDEMQDGQPVKLEEPKEKAKSDKKKVRQ